METINIAKKEIHSKDNISTQISNSHILPENVQDVLKKYMLVDGFDFTLDLNESQGLFLYDAKHKKKLLDFFT